MIETEMNPGKQQQAAERPDLHGWERMIDRLVQPSRVLTPPEAHQQARLLAGATLVLTLLTLIGIVFPVAFGMSNPLEDPFTGIMGATSLVFGIAYILSRSVHHRVGAILTVFVLGGLPFALALSRGDFSPERTPSVFGWSILGLFFSSIFLSWRWTLILAGANVFALSLLSGLVPAVSFTAIFPPLSLMIVVTALLLFTSYHRNQQEKARLAILKGKNDELRALRERLENRVAKRTDDLKKRVRQIRTAGEISQSIGATLDLDLLLTQVVDLIRQRFDLYYVGVFLVNESGSYALLRAGTGEAGNAMVSEGHRLQVGGASMVGWAVANGQARIALDVGQEAVHFNNPHLPETRSELALPLLIGGETIGALTIQSTQPAAFDDDDITVLQSIADGLATAIHNAQLFRQVQESLNEIQALHRNYLSRAWSPEALTDFETQVEFETDSPESGEAQTSELNMPISLRDQVIGHLTLEADKPSWSPEETAFIEAVTTQAAVALENARLLEETRRRVERERMISEVVGKVWGSTDVDSILKTTVRELGRAMDVSEAVIQLQVPEDFNAMDEDQPVWRRGPQE
jgi:GAF domain-containing protein